MYTVSLRVQMQLDICFPAMMLDPDVLAYLLTACGSVVAMAAILCNVPGNLV